MPLSPARAAERLLAALLPLLLLLGSPAFAQQFPPLSGRVVDAANLLAPEREAALTARLEALEQSTGRQLVVATIPDLQGYDIADYGYRLGRAWGIGQKEEDNGILLLVAPNERKVRIEVGYGLEPYVTDALSSAIVQETVLPRFRAGDMPGGIEAGADALLAQLQLSPEEAQARQQQLLAERPSRKRGVPVGLIFWGIVLLFVVLPMLFGGARGKSYRRGRGPVVIWGPGIGGGWGGGSGWGGGGGGFGGFSGGGGSFGGGGASGSW